MNAGTFLALDISLKICYPINIEKIHSNLNENSNEKQKHGKLHMQLWLIIIL